MSNAISYPLDNAKPLCAQCGRMVEKASYRGIIENERLVAWRILYECHGETDHYDVRKDWFQDGAHLDSPFVPRVFEKIAQSTAVSEETALIDVYRSELRDKRDAVRTFVETTLDNLAKDYGLKDVEQLLTLYLVDLQQTGRSIISKDLDIRDLLVEGQIVGQFRFDYCPDLQTATWEQMNFEKPKPKRGAR